MDACGGDSGGPLVGSKILKFVHYFLFVFLNFVFQALFFRCFNNRNFSIVDQLGLLQWRKIDLFRDRQFWLQLTLWVQNWGVYASAGGNIEMAHGQGPSPSGAQRARIRF